MSGASSVPESLQQRVNTANQEKVNLFVSIHFNSFDSNARGTEVFALSNAAIALAAKAIATKL